MSRITSSAMLRTFAVGTAFLVSVAAADTPDAAQRNFVSCPIVRDTKTVPCWLAEYDGELYYLGIQTDVSAEFHPPYLGHGAVDVPGPLDRFALAGSVPHGPDALYDEARDTALG